MKISTVRLSSRRSRQAHEERKGVLKVFLRALGDLRGRNFHIRFSSDQRGHDHIRKPPMDYYRQVYLDFANPMIRGDRLAPFSFPHLRI